MSSAAGMVFPAVRVNRTEKGLYLMLKPTPLFVLCLCASLLMTGVGAIVPLLPQKIYVLSGSLEKVSYIASVFALSYLLIMLPAGILADLIGAKLLLVGGYILCALAGVIYFAADEILLIFVGRLIHGVGEAPLWAFGAAILSHAYPSARGKVIGIYNAAIHLGLACGPALSLIFSQSLEEDMLFLMFSLFGLVGAISISVFLSREVSATKRVEAAASFKEVFSSITSSGKIAIWIGILFFGAGYGSFISILPVSLTAYKAFDSQSVNFIFILFYLSIGAAQILGGIQSDRVGRHLFLILGMFLAGAGFLSFPMVDGEWVYLALLMASFGMGLFSVASLASIFDKIPAELKGVVSGAYYLFWGVGYFAGPICIALMDTAILWSGYTGLAVSFLAYPLIIIWSSSWLKRSL
ncbi:MAG: MFS transporter [Sneathiellales bacterium]|nr:MFS transporter [Sneathiellales bacterium]